MKIKSLQIGEDYVPQKDGFIRVHPDKIKVVEGFNCRRFITGIEELADNIYQHGQDTPIVVNLVDGQLELVAGHRRLLAYKHLNANLLPAGERPYLILARVQQVDPEEARRANLRENVQRNDLSPADIAYSVTRAIDAGMSRAQVALDMGISISAVGDYAKLSRLPVKIQKQLDKHRKLKSAVIEICRLPEDQWLGALEELFAGDDPSLPSAREIVRLRREAELEASAPAKTGDAGDAGDAGPAAQASSGRKAKTGKVLTAKELLRYLDQLCETPSGEAPSDGAILAGKLAAFVRGTLKPTPTLAAKTMSGLLDRVTLAPPPAKGTKRVLPVPVLLQPMLQEQEQEPNGIDDAPAEPAIIPLIPTTGRLL